MQEDVKTQCTRFITSTLYDRSTYCTDASAERTEPHGGVGGGLRTQTNTNTLHSNKQLWTALTYHQIYKIHKSSATAQRLNNKSLQARLSRFRFLSTPKNSSSKSSLEASVVFRSLSANKKQGHWSRDRKYRPGIISQNGSTVTKPETRRLVSHSNVPFASNFPHFTYSLAVPASHVQKRQLLIIIWISYIKIFTQATKASLSFIL